MMISKQIPIGKSSCSDDHVDNQGRIPTLDHEMSINFGFRRPLTKNMPLQVTTPPPPSIWSSKLLRYISLKKWSPSLRFGSFPYGGTNIYFVKYNNVLASNLEFGMDIKKVNKIAFDHPPPSANNRTLAKLVTSTTDTTTRTDLRAKYWPNLK